MTVCIASISPDLGTIVAASDMMLSSADAKADRSVIKFMPLGSSVSWLVFYSGDQVSAFLPVQRDAERRIGNDPSASLADIKQAFAESYRAEIERRISEGPLRRLKMTVDEFLRDGPAMLTKRAFTAKLEAIEAVTLDSLELLVIGFDGFSKPHIFSVDTDGVCRDRDIEGMYAIGSGAFMASAALRSGWQQRRTSAIDEMVYDVCEAAFAARANPYVGDTPMVIVMRSSDIVPLYMIGKPIERLAKIRESAIARKPPARALKIVNDNLRPLRPL